MPLLSYAPSNIVRLPRTCILIKFSQECDIRQLEIRVGIGKYVKIKTHNSITSINGAITYVALLCAERRGGGDRARFINIQT